MTRYVAFAQGFGRLDGDHVVPMGPSLVDHLRHGSADDGPPIPRAEVALMAPVDRPGKIIGVGLNYRAHAAESGAPVPEVPLLFAKFANSLAGPGAVRVPPGLEQVDYEAELGVVIGRRASAVAPGEALDHVAGYCCVNDLSARALQFQTSQWMVGKAVDGFLPVGPWVATADEVGDPQDLRIRCTVNGELRQEAHTGDMVFSVADLVSFISRTCTLEPGDLILTGTPSGVGMGLSPPRYLADGDVVRVEIDGLGALETTVVFG